MTYIKQWVRRLTGYGKASLRRQVLFLVLSCGILTFLMVGLLSLYTMDSIRIAVEKQGSAIEESLKDSLGDLTSQRTRRWLVNTVEDEADHADGKLASIADDVTFLAESMSLILATPEYYRPRSLPDMADSAEFVPGAAYIHYSPELAQQGIDEELRQEIALVSNFANVMVPMRKSYGKYRTSIFAASRKGYCLFMDLVPDGTQSIFSVAENRREFSEIYDPRTRPWYIQAEQTQKLIYTSVYLGADGLPAIACAMPYYDADGFAGVVGIRSSTDDLHRQVMDSVIGNEGIGFALDHKGNVTFSSQQQGILAAVPEYVDLRQTKDPLLARAASCMVAGESNSMDVVVDGNEYFLAFAPMKRSGWSFGLLVSKDEVMAPALQVVDHVHDEMRHFHAILQEDFSSAAEKAVLLLLPLLLASFYASGWMAGRLTRPIRMLASGVQEIAAGNLDKKLDIRTGNELEHLARCVNSMTDDLKAHIESLSNAIAEKERAQTELEVAARIQAGMLPDKLKDSAHSHAFDLSAIMHPATEVGGDFYDFYFVDKDHLVLTVADVSDKGVPAALFMVIAKTLLKDHTRMAGCAENLAEAVETANDALVKSNREFMFVTAFVGMIHLPSGKFTYVNAGHNPPLALRGESFQYLPLAKDPMLGVKDGIPFTAQEIELSGGDAIFLYTDGITEAMNERQEQFMEDKLKAALDSAQNSASGRLRAANILSSVQNAVQRHVGNANQSDDITMLGFVYYGEDRRDNGCQNN